MERAEDMNMDMDERSGGDGAGGGWKVEPRMVYRAQTALVGLLEVGDSRTDIPDLWRRFEEMEPRIRAANLRARYVVITWSGETEVSGLHYLFVGVQVARLQYPPIGSVVKILPASRYALFPAPARRLETAWRFVLEEWLPASPYRTPGYIVQSFDRERYITAPPEQAEIDILAPLQQEVKK
jgi:predicted transcriptional regulator YdeE